MHELAQYSEDYDTRIHIADNDNVTTSIDSDPCLYFMQVFSTHVICIGHCCFTTFARF